MRCTFVLNRILSFICINVISYTYTFGRTLIQRFLIAFKFCCRNSDCLVFSLYFCKFKLSTITWVVHSFKMSNFTKLTSENKIKLKRIFIYIYMCVWNCKSLNNDDIKLTKEKCKSTLKVHN